jgi:hypothetical protein
MVERAAVACDVAGAGYGGGRRRRQRRRRAAAACGSCHLNFQGARTMRANRYRSLCPDIIFLSAILGQNTKYVF